tara:strand:+ start:93 stop:365 length:273 start_codon:yes stop_codon:yes gene_type:complete
MYSLPQISYSKVETSLVSEPKLVNNYRFRVLDSYEEITSIPTSNDYLISPEFKFFYIKQLTDKTVTTGKVELLGLNNTWVNYDNCTTISV